MDEQEDKDKVLRDEKGLFLPGTAPNNPTGYNAHHKGYQRYGDRAAHLLGKYTVEEIKRIVTSPEEFEKLPVYDGMILVNIAGTLAGKDKGKERERLLDRIEGKPKQSHELTGKDGKDLSPATAVLVTRERIKEVDQKLENEF